MSFLTVAVRSFFPVFLCLIAIRRIYFVILIHRWGGKEEKEEEKTEHAQLISIGSRYFSLCMFGLLRSLLRRALLFPSLFFWFRAVRFRRVYAENIHNATTSKSLGPRFRRPANKKTVIRTRCMLEKLWYDIDSSSRSWGDGKINNRDLRITGREWKEKLPILPRDFIEKRVRTICWTIDLINLNWLFLSAPC